MYLNTTYKAFVAETAAKVAAEISKRFTCAGDVSLLKNDEEAESIAISAVNVAEKLAMKLEEWWRSKGDHSTVFFDVQDSLTSRLEGEVAEIPGKIQELTDAVKKLVILLGDDY